MREAAAVVMCVVLSVAAGCGASAPTPTRTPAPRSTPVEMRATEPEHLEGIWFDGQGQRYVRFDSDGTVRAAANPEDLDTESSVAMTYWFEEGLHYVGPGLYWQGIGVYKGYLRIQDGRALLLRWECVEDPDLERRRVYAVTLVRKD